MAVETKLAGTPPIVINSHEWEELAAILRAHLPRHRVWAFGSRATGRRVKRFSDLDLAISGEELTLTDRGKLSEALDESRLPFKVDIVDLDNVAPEFRALIEPDLVPLLETSALRRAG